MSAENKKSNLVNRAGLNAITSYINFGAGAILTFFLSPYLVSFLGSHTFGVWKSIQKLLDFASIADGRASQALKWVIANKKEEDNDRDKQEIIGSALLIWVFFLPILILSVGLLVYFLPSLINELAANEYKLVRIAGLVLGMNIILNPLLNIPDAVLVGINEAHKSTTAQTLWIIASNFLLVFAAFMGYGVIGLAGVILVVTILKGLSVLYICKKNAKWFGIRKPKRNQVTSLFGFSFWIMTWSLISKLLLATEIILLGYLLGPELVTNYTFTSYIFQLGVSVALITGSATIPGLGNSLGAKKYDVVRRIVNGTREISFFVAVLIGGLMLTLNKSFIQLWMGTSFYLGDYANLLITIIMVQLILIRNESQIQDVSLKIKKKVLVGGLGSLLGLLLGVIVFKLMDNSIIGIFYGIIIGRLIPFIAFPLMVNKMFEVKTSYMRYVFGFAVLLVCYWSAIYLPDSTSWISFFLKTSITLAILVLISFFGLLSKDNRELLIRRVLNKIEK